MTVSACAAIERLSPQQIDGRLASTSVVYLPLGSLEFHGPHLPIGLDALTAHGICLRAAEQHGGVVLPPFYQAVGGEHSRYPWTFMSETEGAIEAVLIETLSRLEQHGVGRAILFSGHFADEQRELINRVAQSWNAAGTSMTVVARTLGEVPEPLVDPDHAGRFESLVLHALSPDLVHVHELPDEGAYPTPVGEDPYGQDRHRRDHPLHGIFGADPRSLDTDMAAPLLAHLVSWVASLAR